MGFRFALGLFVFSLNAGAVGIQLINGAPATAGQYPEVVQILGDGKCTATLVGPQILLTAAHCGEVGEEVAFSYKGKSYTAKIAHSALYADYEHDVAVAYLPAAIPGATPMSVGGSASYDDTLLLMGYGCTKKGGGPSDGVLRYGTTSIIDVDAVFFTSHSSDQQAALCFGDSGGPAFVKAGNQLVLVGINSRGNIKNVNINTRLDTPESQDFLKEAAQVLKMDICGVTKACP